MRLFVRSPLVVSLLVSLLVGLGLLGLRQAGGFEALELAAYDWFLRLRPEAPADPRIVLITVTEPDIHQQRWPVSDATLARALQMLTQYHPRAIGLDIYRDIPVERGHTEFETTWRNHANIIAVTKVGALETLVPPPQVLQETEQVGFNDIIVDPGSTVRRGLLFLDESNTTFYSLHHPGGY